MDILSNLRDRAKALQRTIVLPEGEDSRTLDAAAALLKDKIAKIIILGDIDKIKSELKSRDVQENFTALNPLNDAKLEEYIEKYYEMRKSKGMTKDEAAESMKKDNFFGSMLVKEGVADGAVMGAVHTTADVLRAGLRIIGTKPGNKTVSSCFIMVTNKKEFGENGAVVFGDCAVNPDPTAEMLADIAISTAESCKLLLNTEPKIAMLSFSTKGSASTESTKKVISAVDIIKAKAPNIQVDGELQADAALIPSVGDRKAPGSNVAGKANILIFPDLNAGNIGYKLVERFAGAQAIGPVIQGFAKPISDLSRGCNYMDIVNVAAITSVLSNSKN